MESELIEVTVKMPRSEAVMFQKMSPDEPRFTVRAQDLFAPMVVKLWALLCRTSGIDTQKVNEAEATAEAMVQWPGRKLPD